VANKVRCYNYFITVKTISKVIKRIASKYYKYSSAIERHVY